MKVDRSAGLTLWGCLLLSQFSSAESYWGLGGGAGYWSADARDLRTELESALRDPGLAPAKGSVEKGRWNWEAEAFYEWSLRDSWRLGFAAGYGHSATSLLDETVSSGANFNTTQRVEAGARAVPFTLYLKWKAADRPFSLYGGMGGHYLMARTTFDNGGPDGRFQAVFKKDKLAPHVQVGGEYFLLPGLAFGLSPQHLFLAGLEDFRATLSGAVGLVDGEYQLAMATFGTPDLFLAFNRLPDSLAPPDRLFRLDFGGLRLKAGLRYYFGGASPRTGHTQPYLWPG